MENNHHNCGCGHDHHDHDHGHHHHEGEYETINLTLEDGREMECIVLEIYKIEDQEYIALLPEGEENVMLYRFNEEDNEGPQLTNIEDDAEFKVASEVFLQLMQIDIEEEDETEE